MILNSFRDQLRVTPFPHACVKEAFDSTISLEILSWLENQAPWSLRIAEFYEQYEFGFADVELPEAIAKIFSHETLQILREKIESIFETKLSTQIDITAHKLITGQRIRIHNDFIPEKETHRVLIQLNRGWTEDNGGVLMLFSSKDTNSLHSIFIPEHNTSVIFEISPISFHAVSPINSGYRYTLVLSFYRASE